MAKITALKTFVVRGNFDWVFVEIETDEGTKGIGESYWGPGVKETIRHLESVLIGEDPQNIDYLYQRMIRALSGAGSTGGTAVTAISGIEIALWDLKGKLLNTPVYNLLGGKYRDKIRLYADCGQPGTDPEKWIERANLAASKGFTAVKFDIDHINETDSWPLDQQTPLTNEDLELTIELVSLLRKNLQPEIDIAIDCHWSFNFPDAIKIIKALEPFNLLWLEDPIPPDNIDVLMDLTSMSKIPICSGENHYTRHGFREMITKRAVNIVQPDIPKCGGLLEAKKIADLADIYYMPFAAHNVSSPLGTIAAAHVCSTMRNFLALEFHGQDLPWWHDLCTTSKEVVSQGFITLPNSPGLGIELDEKTVKLHLKE